jgi:hypothetical protein
MTVSLFVWVIIVLALPKVSPMLARIIYPVESEQVVKFRKRMVLDDLQKTFIQESTQIHNKYKHIPDKLITYYFAGKGSYERMKYVPTEERIVLPLDAELTALRKKNQEQKYYCHEYFEIVPCQLLHISCLWTVQYRARGV